MDGYRRVSPHTDLLWKKTVSLLCGQVIFLIVYLGYYVRVEPDNVCFGQRKLDSPVAESLEDAVDVSANFDNIMKLYILYYGASILRCLYILYLIRIRKSTGE